MRNATLPLFALLAACGGAEDHGANGVPATAGAKVQTADLTGLYEASAGAGQRGQMCIVSGESGAASFGIVSEAADGGSCGGAGTAIKEGETLRLAMSGDEQCVIDARIAGVKVTFPAAVPQGCAYYCAPGATLGGRSFVKTGGTAQDAMRATDLAGDPLCG